MFENNFNKDKSPNRMRYRNGWMVLLYWYFKLKINVLCSKKKTNFSIMCIELLILSLSQNKRDLKFI